MKQKEQFEGLTLLATAIKRIDLKNDLTIIPDGAYDKFSFQIELVETKKTLVHEHKKIYMHDGVIRLTIWLTILGAAENETGTQLEFTIEGAFMSNISMEDVEFSHAIRVYGGQMLYDMARTEIMHLTSSIYSSGKYIIPTIAVGNFVSESGEHP